MDFGLTMTIESILRRLFFGILLILLHALIRLSILHLKRIGTLDTIGNLDRIQGVFGLDGLLPYLEALPFFRFGLLIEITLQLNLQCFFDLGVPCFELCHVFPSPSNSHGNSRIYKLRKNYGHAQPQTVRNIFT